jgi:hypothetical protein
MKEEQVPPKRRFLQEPYGVTSQKTPIFIVTAVKTSNLKSQNINGENEVNNGIYRKRYFILRRHNPT